MKKVLIVVAMLALTGCTGLSVPASVAIYGAITAINELARHANIEEIEGQDAEAEAEADWLGGTAGAGRALAVRPSTGSGSSL